jgi:hypothetical protein
MRAPRELLHECINEHSSGAEKGALSDGAAAQSLSPPYALGSVVLCRQHSHTLVPTDAGEPFSTEPEDVVRVPSFPMHRHVRCAHCLT